VTGRDGAAPVAALARSLALDLVHRDRPPSGVVGVGVDAVDLARFARVLERRASVADRLFTEAELAYARSTTDPVPRLSTRFAAKEAVMKAMGVGLWAYPFHDVEVKRDGLDAPYLVLSAAALALASRAGVVRWHLSLSHTDRVAVALVVAERGPVLTDGDPDSGPGGVSVDSSPAVSTVPPSTS